MSLKSVISPILAAAVLALGPATPSKATADEAGPSLGSCAALYYAVNHERRATPGIPSPAEILGMDNIDWLGADMFGGSFWVFSNATVIDWDQRYRALEARSGQSDVAFMLQVMSIQGGPLETMPRNADPAFPLAEQAPLSFSATLPSREDTPPYGRRLARCDEAFGFAPSFWFGTPEPLACAAALYLASTDGPEYAARAIAEARNAVQAHIAAHGGDQLELENRVVAQAQARLLRLQSGTEPVDGARFDIQICRREFGVQP
ncbi:MAG: hypothetical protein GC187_04200 [Alphaproteobacteria bacterium]|nr:hypothetical protein [Alphaproteobacteria bacterium]